MTDEERDEQIVQRVYGNVHMEHPAITLDMVRQVLKERRRVSTLPKTPKSPAAFPSVHWGGDEFIYLGDGRIDTTGTGI